MNKNLARLALVLLGTQLSLSGCRVGRDERVAPQGNFVGLSYFETEQYAFSDFPELSTALSSFYGYFMVATGGSTFVALYNPKPGCMFEVEDRESVDMVRPMDVGDLKVSGDNLADTILKRSSTYFTFYAGGSILTDKLLGGSFRLQNVGESLPLQFDQSFVQPGAGSNIKIKSGSGNFVNLPTPAIDSSVVVGLSRSQSVTVGFSPPLGAQYVRLKLGDGSSDQKGNIVCYGKATDGQIVVPSDYILNFLNTSDGVMFLDFVNTKLDTDKPKLAEAFIRATTRHIHGRYDIAIDGQLQETHFGTLIFQ